MRKYTKENVRHFLDVSRRLPKLPPRLMTGTVVPQLGSSSVSSIITAEITNIAPKIPFVLDQGAEGTCIANSVAYGLYANLAANQSLRPIGSDLTRSPHIASRAALQYCENMVVNGMNPGFVSGNPLLQNVATNNDRYDTLFNEGAWFAFSVAALASTYIPAESVWTYPQPYQTSFPNYFYPLRSGNPLLTTNWTPTSNGRYSSPTSSVYSANFGILTRTATSFSTTAHYMNADVYADMVNNWIAESYLLYDDRYAAANQTALLRWMITQLGAGTPLHISFLVDGAFESIGSDGLYSPAQLVDSGDILGGHANTIIGVIYGSTWKAAHPSSPNLASVGNTDRLFVFKNSWGAAWGDGGHWYMRVPDFFNVKISDLVPGFINTMFTQSAYIIGAASR